MDSLTINPKLKLDTQKRQHRSFERLFEGRRGEVIRLLRQTPAVADAVGKFTTGRTYEAVIPPDAWKQLQYGTAKWDRREGGLLGAVIRDKETGQIICQVKLREVSPELLSSVNQLGVQQALTEIIQRLDVIEKQLNAVQEGLQDTHFAIVESGADLYEQALAMRDLDNRRIALHLASQQLTEGRRRLRRSLENNLRFADELPEHRWGIIRWSLNPRNRAGIEQRVKPVQEGLRAILGASAMLVLVHDALGEPDVIQASLRPLREMLTAVGEQGAHFARWLPYNPTAPPEELWHRSMERFGGEIGAMCAAIGSVPDRGVQIEMTAGEFKA